MNRFKRLKTLISVFLIMLLSNVISPAFVLADLSGTQYQINDEVFDNGGGMLNGGTYQLHNSTLGPWVGGSLTGVNNNVLVYHTFKDINNPVCSGMNFWLPDPDIKTQIMVSWEAIDDNFLQDVFNTGIAGYDVNYRIDGGVWVQLSPTTANTFNPATQALMTIAAADIDKVFDFQVRALDLVGNVNDSCGIMSVQFADLWFQGVDGNVHSNGNVVDPISSIADEGFIVDDSFDDLDQAGGIASAGGTTIDPSYGEIARRGVSVPGWNISNYGTIDSPNYAWFYDQLDGEEAMPIPDGGDGIVSSAEFLTALQADSVTMPNIIVDNSDGYVYGQQGNYLSARITATGHNTSQNSFPIGQLHNGNYRVNRAYMLFDTSAIPDTATVYDVRLNMRMSGAYAGPSFDVLLYKYDWLKYVPISPGNRNDVYTASNGVFDQLWRNTTGMVAGTHYANSATLDPSWVNKEGLTGYQARSSKDVSGTAPAFNTTELINIHSGNAAQENNRPYLSVKYANHSRYLVDGDLTIDASIAALTGRNAVIFVTGNLDFAVNPEIDQNASLIFIVQGDIWIDNFVDQVDAMLYADGTIYSADNAIVYNGPHLTVNGNLISQTGVTLQRRLTPDLDNLVHPIERVILNPKYYFTLGGEEFLGVSHITWEEITE